MFNQFIFSVCENSVALYSLYVLVVYYVHVLILIDLLILKTFPKFHATCHIRKRGHKNVHVLITPVVKLLNFSQVFLFIG